jgi:hypothetical protein
MARKASVARAGLAGVAVLRHLDGVLGRLQRVHAVVRALDLDVRKAQQRLRRHHRPDRAEHLHAVGCPDLHLQVVRRRLRAREQRHAALHRPRQFTQVFVEQRIGLHQRVAVGRAGLQHRHQRDGGQHQPQQLAPQRRRGRRGQGRAHRRGTT